MGNIKKFLFFSLIILTQCGWVGYGGAGWQNPILNPGYAPTTSQTVTSAQSGQIIVFNGTGNNTSFTLPTATIGLNFTFISNVNKYFAVIPQSTDTIALGSSTQGQPVNNVLSSAAGDSITLECQVNGTWSVQSITGSWDSGSTPISGTWTQTGNFLYPSLITSNVGIGSTAPGQALDVNGTLRLVSGNILFQNGGGNIATSGGLNTITLRPNGAGSTVGGVTTNTSGVTNFFDSSGISQVIFNNDNVGIGSVAPGAQLDVEGTLKNTFLYGNGGGGVAIGTTNLVDGSTIGQLKITGGSNPITNPPLVLQRTAVAATLAFYESNSNWQLDTTDGTSNGDGIFLHSGAIIELFPATNVGIGTSVTNAKLQVDANNSVNMELKNTSASGGIFDFRPSVSGVTNGGFQITDKVNTITPFTIAVTGGGVDNVGIGTVLPSSQLSVGGNESIGIAYNNGQAAPTNGLLIQGNVGIGTPSAGASNPVDIYDATVSPSLLIGSDGTANFSPSIYLNRSNSTSISDTGTIIYRPGGGAAQGLIFAESRAGNDGNIVFQTAGTNNRMVINGFGNVGIGSITPGQKLDINGTVRVFGGSGAASTAACWCSDGVTLGHAAALVVISGAATCLNASGATC